MFTERQIQSVIAGTSTRDEAREVVKWFASEEGQKTLSAIIDTDSEHGTADNRVLMIPSDQMLLSLRRAIRWRKISHTGTRVAMVLLPIILMVWQFCFFSRQVNIFSDSDYEEIYVPKGERMQIIFQDGSKAYLNSDTRLCYPRKFALSDRSVRLKGEAFFEVAKNPGRPFKVDLDGVQAVVYGTRFDAMAYPGDDRVEITLESGSVSLGKEDNKLVDLRPGEKVVYSRSTDSYSVEKPEDILSVSIWKTNQFVFCDTPLEEVLKILSRCYDETFEIKDSTALRYGYDLITSRKDIRTIISELEKISPVRFKKQNSVYTVTIDRENI